MVSMLTDDRYDGMCFENMCVIDMSCDIATVLFKER